VREREKGREGGREQERERAREQEKARESTRARECTCLERLISPMPRHTRNDTSPGRTTPHEPAARRGRRTRPACSPLCTHTGSQPRQALPVLLQKQHLPAAFDAAFPLLPVICPAATLPSLIRSLPTTTTINTISFCSSSSSSSRRAFSTRGTSQAIRAQRLPDLRLLWRPVGDLAVYHCYACPSLLRVGAGAENQLVHL